MRVVREQTLGYGQTRENIQHPPYVLIMYFGWMFSVLRMSAGPQLRCNLISPWAEHRCHLIANIYLMTTGFLSIAILLPNNQSPPCGFPEWPHWLLHPFGFFLWFVFQKKKVLIPTSTTAWINTYRLHGQTHVPLSKYSNFATGLFRFRDCQSTKGLFSILRRERGGNYSRGLAVTGNRNWTTFLQ